MRARQPEHSRSYHSEDRRRSMSRKEFKKYKMDKIKLQFRTISNRISDMKQQNHQDIEQLQTLLKGSDALEQMAHQGLQHAKMVWTEPAKGKRRVTMPSVLEHQRVSMFEVEPTREHRHMKEVGQIQDDRVNLPTEETEEGGEGPKKTSELSDIKERQSTLYVEDRETKEEPLFREMATQVQKMLNLQSEVTQIEITPSTENSLLKRGWSTPNLRQVSTLHQTSKIINKTSSPLAQQVKKKQPILSFDNTMKPFI